VDKYYMFYFYLRSFLTPLHGVIMITYVIGRTGRAQTQSI